MYQYFADIVYIARSDHVLLFFVCLSYNKTLFAS